MPERLSQKEVPPELEAKLQDHSPGARRAGRHQYHLHLRRTDDGQMALRQALFAAHRAEGMEETPHQRLSSDDGTGKKRKRPAATLEQHVVPHGDTWAIHKAGSDRASEVFPTKDAAVSRARDLAAEQDGHVIIHRADGTFQEVTKPRKRREGGAAADGVPEQHVIPHDDGWAVRKAGSEKATKVFETKKEAIQHGREIAENQDGRLVIHRADGTFEETRLYYRRS